MLAKIAKFRFARLQHAASRQVAFAHSSDKYGERGAAGSSRTRRPNLECRWRPMIGAGLGCNWNLELADGAATEEPDQRWIIICICRLSGSGQSADWRTVSANG